MWAAASSELGNPEPGDTFEVSPVESRHLETEIEGGGSNDEILERDDIAYRRLLALDTAS